MCINFLFCIHFCLCNHSKLKEVETQKSHFKGFNVFKKCGKSFELRSNCEKMFPHDDESKWFLPFCNRINAENLLKGRKDGTFLVRSSARLEGLYVLSIVIKGNIKHIVINKNENGYCLHGNERHPTLMSLIMCYAQPNHQNLSTSVDESGKTLHFPVFN